MQTKFTRCTIIFFENLQIRDTIHRVHIKQRKLKLKLETQFTWYTFTKQQLKIKDKFHTLNIKTNKNGDTVIRRWGWGGEGGEDSAIFDMKGQHF